MHEHVEDRIIILDHDMVHHSWNGKCDIFLPRETLAARHIGTKNCMRDAELMCRCISANDGRLAAGMEFQDNDQVLEKVNTFKYMGRIIYFDGSDWYVVSHNLQIAWRKWVQLSWLLG